MFKVTRRKNNSKVTQVYNVDFYPSISMFLLLEALDAASQYATIEASEIEMFLQARK